MFFTNNAVELKKCLTCDHDDLEMILDLNMQPLANSYKLNRNDLQEEFPLAINHCKNCHHVQLTHAINPDLMFKDYLYVSGTSNTMKDHCRWFADYATEYFTMTAKRSAVDVLDIGCNDGTQLNSFKDKNLETFGIDPAENLYETSSKNHNVWVGYFDQSSVLKTGRKFDIITAQNVFAHNYDPLGFLLTAKQIMSNDSLLFIQTSQADMILNNEFDTIYHEHISFYNINSMNELCKRAELNLIDVVKCPLHGNSYLFVIAKELDRSSNVRNLIDMERKTGLLSNNTYKIYTERCEKVAVDFRNTILKAKEEGYKIIGYGAAAKGMTLLNYAKIDMDYIVDDNKLKQGRFTPGSSIPIVAFEDTNISVEDKVVFVPLAWNFFDEIRNRIKEKRNRDVDKFLRYFPLVGYVSE